MSRFHGKNTVIIGGTHGMGLGLAYALADGGAAVMLTGANQANVAAAGQALAGRAAAIRADIADLADLDALAGTAAAQFGQIDALFIFAAIAEFAAFDQVTTSGFDRQFAVNARGAFFAMQRFVPLIREGGSITAVTVTPATATPGMAVYMAIKAAVRAFAQVLAAELLGRRIRVNCLAPGFIATPTLGVAGLSPGERRTLSAIGDAATPMKRHGTIDEVARATLFLGFDATFSTGIELAVDGGISTVDNPQ